MNVRAQQLEPAPRGLPLAGELDALLRTASPAQVIATALQTVGRERLAVVSSFGTESAAFRFCIVGQDINNISFSKLTPG
jgi:phosphoadenosine phosphosulfate reductase